MKAKLIKKNQRRPVALIRITERRDEARNYMEAVTDEITTEILAIDPDTGKPRYSRRGLRQARTPARAVQSFKDRAPGENRRNRGGNRLRRASERILR